MSCRHLGALDVFGDIVDVSEDRRAKAAGLDGLGEVDFLLDSGTHPADLDVGQGLLPAQHKVMGESGQQVFFNLRHKGDGPLAGFGLRFAHHAQISGWVSDRPLDVDGVSVEVEVLPLEAKHFFGAKRMQRRQSDVSPVPVAADAVDVGDQVLHTLHGIRHGCGAGPALDAKAPTVKRAFCDEAIVKSLIENHVEHTSCLVFCGFCDFIPHVVEEGLNVSSGDFLNQFVFEQGEDVMFKLSPISQTSHIADIRLREDVIPVPSVLLKIVADHLRCSITATEHLQELFGILLFSVSGNPSLHPVDHYGSADFL